MILVTDGMKHPAYNDALQNAVRRATNTPDESFSVVWDGEAVWVIASYAKFPPNAKTICVAQRWDATTVQVRFHGARSEWVKI